TTSRQVSPSGLQRLQCLAQQYSPSPQTASPHGSRRQSLPVHGTSGAMQSPPQRAQQTVPSAQRIAAQGSWAIGAQMPPQSAPPCAGSQSSRGSSTQTKPSAHGRPVIPPQKRRELVSPGRLDESR